MKRWKYFLALTFLLGATVRIEAQSGDKVKAIVDRAITAMGGDAFLAVKSYSAAGRYYAIKDDEEGWAEFTDQTRLPYKTRQQIGKKGDAELTILDLEAGKGWHVYGGTEIKPLKPEEVEYYKRGAKHDFNNIFRSRMQEPGMTLHYFGSDSIDGRRSVEIVQMIDAENDTIQISFDSLSGLPFRLEYRDILVNGRKVLVWDEYYNWHVVGGINTPMRQDRLHNGQASGQVFYRTIEYNPDLPDSLFAEPTPPPPKKKKGKG